MKKVERERNTNHPSQQTRHISKRNLIGTVLTGIAMTLWLTGCGATVGNGQTGGNQTANQTSSMSNMPGMSGMSSSSSSSSGTKSGDTTGSSAQNSAQNQKPVPMKVSRNGHNVSIDMYTERTAVQVAPGVSFDAWTFDGTVPGPVLYLKEGDHVRLTLHNLDSQMSHSIDLHAALVAPNQAFTEVAPGSSKTLEFVASVPGVFMYHCESAPMALHIAQGMYGAVVVTPPGQAQPTYTIVQSEIYQANDYQSVMNDKPTYVVFNGEANRYVEAPLSVHVGQPITVAFVNAGPNDFSAFHVVGTVLRDVQASGDRENHLYNVQTYTVAPGDGALIHLKFDAPGTYSFVTHSMRDMELGAMGQFQVK